ncbi:ricin-type beta-trefoil lectin domain protein [Streptomyces sannanensis]|uniref:ricin-type beta-trefoil lectin domain protein n=1 Tax=Streptomyces sannanensis TaxID=285536 RepID=UPI0031E94372
MTTASQALAEEMPPGRTTIRAAEAHGTGASRTSEETEALRKAAHSGRPAEILGRRDETTQVLANPDGTFTWRQYVRPAFARAGGAWRKADATLERRPDGRLAPVAAVLGLSFSGGGSGPLATMAKNGRTLSLTWPGALPEPRLDGDTAVYPEVLPGVDLRIRADVDGFAQHLVVKSREAAADPRIAELSLGLKGEGTRLTADRRGNLTATDSKGAKVFSAPAPAMWDSSHLSKAEADKLRTGSAQAEPAPSARLVEMDTEVAGDRLRIVPDAAMLKDPKTVFPVVIDPVFSGGQRNNWALAYKQTSNPNIAGTAYWNGGTFTDKLARVGYESQTGFTGRSYFQMNTKGLQGSRIISAVFNVFNNHSWSCTATPVELGWTGPISPSTTWNKQPDWLQTLETRTFAHGWSTTSCPAKGEDFAAAPLKSAVQQVADAGGADLTLGLRSRADYETNTLSWKKFHSDPYLEVTYNTPPKVDSSAAYQGSWSLHATGLQPLSCSADPATWPTAGNTGLTLTAQVSDAQGGQLTAAFSLAEHQGAVVTAPTTTVTSGGIAQVRVPASSLVDGRTYEWTVQARDGTDTSAWTAPCRFRVDKTAPAKPTVTAADGYALDVAQVKARENRTIRFASSDTVGLDGFCYTLNNPLAVAGTKCSNGTFVAAGPDGTATVTVKPSLWPNNRLHVQAYDKAGNTSPYDGGDGSPETDTTLIVTDRPDFVRGPDGRARGDLPGDLDGDGHIDMLTTATDGNLRLYAGDGAGTGDVKAGVVVDRGGWNGARIAHRGDFVSATEGQTKDGYEDFFVKIGNKLYLYPGDGNGMPLPSQRKELIHPANKQTGPLTGAVGGKCLDVRSGSTANGTPIQYYTCNGTAAQDFHLTGGALKVLGKCVAAAGTDNFAAVTLWDCDGSPAQQWLDRGDRLLVNAASGRCLDLPWANPADGNALAVYDCNGTDAQVWNVPGSWAGVRQIVTPGNADGMPGSDLMVQEGADMWLYSGTAEGPLSAQTGTHQLLPGTKVGGAAWDQYDWLAPGDINGDGSVDLLGRATTGDPASTVYGKLFLYPGSLTTDPSTGTTAYGVGARTAYGNGGWQPASIPSLASAGNAQGTVVDNGDYRQFVPTAGEETPDLWATIAQGTGNLRFYPGRAAVHGTPVVVDEAAWTSSVTGIF